MRLRKDQVHTLSKIILDHLRAKALIEIKAEEEAVLNRIEGVIIQNLEAEDLLDQEVEKILEQYRSQIRTGQLNERELFLKIKKELAKQKKFVL